jgi:hypothetical protein
MRTSGKLTAAKVKGLTEVGYYGDGEGRFLRLADTSGQVTKS